MHRKALEQRLAELALNISEKSAHEAAEALLNLYKDFKYEALENELSAQFHAAENELKAKLQARLAELQSQVQAPKVEASQMPEPAPAPPAPAPEVVEEIPAPVAEAAAPEAESVEEVPAEVVEEIPAPAPAAQVQMEIPAAETEPEAEMPAPEAVEETPAQEIPAPAAPKATGAPKSLNDRLAGKKLTFGLNDRIGFVKELFDGSTEDFNRVVSQLNTMSTVDEATSFLTEFVAPDYNWDAHEEAANRFLLLVEQRFG